MNDVLRTEVVLSYVFFFSVVPWVATGVIGWFQLRHIGVGYPALRTDQWSCRLGLTQTEQDKDSAQTHVFCTFQISPAWTYNHTLDSCLWLWCMWRTVFVIVQSFWQIAHYCVRDGSFTFYTALPCMSTYGRHQSSCSPFDSFLCR